MAIVLPSQAYPSQQVGIELLHEALTEYLAKPSELNVVNIVGGAGAGKSWTTINGLIPTVLDTIKESEDPLVKYMGVYMTTTTHQANSVIVDELVAAGINTIDVSTIHSFLQIVPWTGSCTSNPPLFTNCGFKINGDPNSNRVIVFVDEAFRIDPNLWAIMQYMRPNALWVCTYDAYQTPPVGHSTSPIDSLDVPRAVLRESPRFVNAGELSKLVVALRKAVEYQEHDYTETFMKFDGTAYDTVPRKEYGDIIRKSIEAGEKLPKDVLMVCGTRKQTAKYNNGIHKLRLSNGQPIFDTNDPILVEYNIGQQESPLLTLLRRERRFLSEFIPEKVHPKHPHFHILKRYKYVYRYKDTDNYIVPEFAPDSKPPFKMYRECAKEGIVLIGIRLNYARTVHTAQGMTVPYVYMDTTSIYAWANHDMRRRLLYTGASRCSGKLKVVE